MIEAEHRVTRATILILTGVIFAFVARTYDVFGGPTDTLSSLFLMVLAALALAVPGVRVLQFKMLAIALWTAYVVFGVVVEGAFRGRAGWLLTGAMMILIAGLVQAPERSTKD
ncbi:MAG: hypothetical protein ACRDTM_14340 [Micromonosporaceae bacterium]